MSFERFLKTLKTEEEFVTKKLERWAEELGTKTFIYYGEQNKSITFKKFNEMANSIANCLIEKGIKKGDRISLFLRNPLVTTYAMFGIWKAGAVFCPINFNYKGKLLSYQINDTKPQMLITERQLIPLINEIKEEVPSLEVIMHNPQVDDHDYNPSLPNEQLAEKFQMYLFDQFLDGDVSNPGIELNFWDTANIIYTSGTTGPAKGVVQSYRWMHGYTYLFKGFTSQEDVLYNDLPLYHVGGATQLVTRAAFVGCTVAIWDKFSPNDFWKRIEKCGATNTILVDVMIPWLMKEKESENDRNNTLKWVHMQPLPHYHHDVAKRFGFDFVTSGFGQTEAGNGFLSIIDEVEDDNGTPPELYKGYSRKEIIEIALGLNIPVQKGNQAFNKGFMGTPAPFFDAAILNEHDEECKPGESGQIAFRPQVPHLILEEYFNNSKATAEVFQNLWFHTGDIGYQDENGFYYFVDRMKSIIRRRGENISSYQVEDIINQNSHVNVSAAFPIPADEGDEDDIVVYVVPKSNQLSEKGLMEWVRNEMPKFMWPKFIRIIDDLPRTPTNKIEKYKLKTQILEELKKGSTSKKTILN